MPTHYARKNTEIVTLRFQGNMVPGFYDVRTGGEADSSTDLYYPGGNQDPIPLAGRKTFGNIVMSRIFSDDDMALLERLINGAGKAAVQVYQQPTDDDGNRWGRSVWWKGVLKRVTHIEVDSTSLDAGTYEIEIVVNAMGVGT